MALLEITTDLYQRRLAREIRMSFKWGVYYRSQRVQEVKFSKGTMMIRTSMGWSPVVNVDEFFDGFGRHITALRS